ncbi:MAG TPA: LuxR C-terminal-related transcriptional regulator [Flavobacteriales bacterium]|nr:LuxR C-terminal-related transcriptional regulator [Flavobacteriales bacterium]
MSSSPDPKKYSTEEAELRRTLVALRTHPPKPMEHPGTRIREILGLMPLFPDHFIYVYDFSEARIRYCRGFPEVLGYKNEEVDLDMLFALVHPDDAPIIWRINRCVVEAISQLDRPLDPFDICLTVDYRIRKSNGHYIKVLRNTAIFDTDEGTGKVTSTFSLCRDISTFKSSNSIGWQVKGARADQLDTSALDDLTPRMLYRPTTREMEVVRELALGKSTKLIALELKLSEHTVTTHRKNLLKRTGMKNTVELVHHVKEAGWL